MRLGYKAALIGLAGCLAGAEARAGPEPAREVIVVADGLDAPALAEALALRVPQARVVARCQGAARGDVRADRRGDSEHVREDRSGEAGQVREDSRGESEHARGAPAEAARDGRGGSERAGDDLPESSRARGDIRPESSHVRGAGRPGDARHVREDSCACGPGCTLARLRRDGDALLIDVEHADGRAFTRASAAEAGEPERAAAASLAHLLAAIDEGTATPGPSEPPMLAAPPETATIVAPVERAAPIASEPIVAGPVSPRFEIGPVVAMTEVFGVGRPAALAGRVGGGGHVGVELRGRGGLLVGVELRGLAARDGDLRLGRARVAVALGHSLRRGLFELRTRAALVVEPWWVGARTSGAPPTAGAPLLGGALSVSPGLSAVLAPRVRLFAGLRLEASLTVDPRTGAIVQAVDAEATPRFRLGGVELAAAAELGVRWGIGGRR